MMKAINNPLFKASQVLKDFINGKLNYSPSNLKVMMQNTVKNVDCFSYQEECFAINKAISNL